MKLRGITSVLAAGVAVSMVALVGASGEDPTLEAVPAPPVVKASPRPAPGIDSAQSAVREAFGESDPDAFQAFSFADPLGVQALGQGSEVLAAAGTLGFDPFNAPTPEIVQPGGEGADPVVMPLPSAPATIPTTTVESIGKESPGALLSQPVNGRSTSRFGMRFHPVLRVYKLHTGHDWAAPCGTPVGAAAAGTVVRTGWAGGNGVQVKLDHGMLGGYRVVTTYNHLSSIGVKVGQKVNALQGVGRVGNTGYSTGCHLHFEVIADGQFTDPIPWLNGKPGMVDLSQMGADVSALPGSPSASPSASPTPSPTPSVAPETTAAPAAPTPGDTTAAEPTTPVPTPTTSAPGQAGGAPSPEKPVVEPEPVVTPTETVPTTPAEEMPSETPTPDPTDPVTPTPDPTTDPSATPEETPTVEVPPSTEPEPTDEPTTPSAPAPAPTQTTTPTAAVPTETTPAATTGAAPTSELAVPDEG